MATRDFACHVCGTSYTENKSLLRHLRSKAHAARAGGKADEYPCSFLFCRKSFDREDMRQRHENEVHHALKFKASQSLLQPRSGPNNLNATAGPANLGHVPIDQSNFDVPGFALMPFASVYGQASDLEDWMLDIETLLEQQDDFVLDCEQDIPFENPRLKCIDSSTSSLAGTESQAYRSVIRRLRRRSSTELDDFHILKNGIQDDAEDSDDSEDLPVINDLPLSQDIEIADGTAEYTPENDTEHPNFLKSLYGSMMDLPRRIVPTRSMS